MNHNVFGARWTPGFMADLATFQGFVNLMLTIRAIKTGAEAPEVGWDFDSDSEHSYSSQEKVERSIDVQDKTPPL